MEISSANWDYLAQHLPYFTLCYDKIRSTINILQRKKYLLTLTNALDLAVTMDRFVCGGLWVRIPG